MPRLQFWFELASNYSYLAAMRIAGLAQAAGVDVEWRPFLLGPIFKAQGWSTSPFNLYPAKGRNMLRDMERICAARGLPFVMPATFPATSLLASRLAVVGEAEGWTARFARAAYMAEFGRGEDIADRRVLTGILAGIGVDAAKAMEAAGGQPAKDRLKSQTEEAMRLGIFGAPSFITGDGELFWGDDRLEQALAWAKRGAPAPGQDSKN
jgi:2-hydroxychromene-2-carboxylate isomerase